IASEHTPALSSAAVVNPHSSPTPRSASASKSSGTPSPAGGNPAPTSNTMPSAEPAEALEGMGRLSPEPATIPLNSPSAAGLSPEAPGTYPGPAGAPDKVKGIDRTVVIEQASSKTRSAPPSSDPTHLLAGRSQRGDE